MAATYRLTAAQTIYRRWRGDHVTVAAGTRLHDDSQQQPEARTPELAAAVHVLGLLHDDKWRPYISTAGIDWPGIEDGCFSSSEQVVCDAAHDLWNGGGGTDFAELLRRLDDRAVARVFEAIKIRRGSGR